LQPLSANARLLSSRGQSGVIQRELAALLPWITMIRRQAESGRTDVESTPLNVRKRRGETWVLIAASTWSIVILKDPASL